MQTNSSDNCIDLYNVEILNLFDPELQLRNTKSVIKNKSKTFFNELKRYRVQAVIALGYKKRKDSQMFR